MVDSVADCGGDGILKKIRCNLRALICLWSNAKLGWTLSVNASPRYKQRSTRGFYLDFIRLRQNINAIVLEIDGIESSMRIYSFS